MKLRWLAGNGIAAGLGLATSLLPVGFIPGLRGEYLPVFLWCSGLAGAAYLVGILQAGRGAVGFKTIWVTAVTARLVLLASTPTLSDDVYRYLWDGHLVTQGVNPYALAVNSPDLDVHATALRELVNHPGMASPYLPAAQAYFGMVEWAAPQQVKAFQAAATLVDLLVGIVLVQLLKLLHLPRAAVLVYLWNPLVIFEFTHSAHVDVVMILLMLLAWLAFWREVKGGLLSTWLLALATLTKAMPVLFVPVFMRKWRPAGVLVYALATGAGLAVFAAEAGWGLRGEMDGTGVFGALRIFARYWQFNAGPLFLPAKLWSAGDGEIAGRVSRLPALILAVILLAWYTRQAWRVGALRQAGDTGAMHAMVRLAFLPLGTSLLLSPTVHPWYVTWLLPFAALCLPVKTGPSWSWLWMAGPVYFSLAVALSYLAYLPGNGVGVPGWVTWVEYLPVYLWFGWVIAGLQRGTKPG